MIKPVRGPYRRECQRLCFAQDSWIGYVLVCCFGLVFTLITQGELLSVPADQCFPELCVTMLYRT